MKTEAFSCCHFRRCRQRSNRPSWCQPFVHCCQVRPGPVFFSNGSLYPLAEISGNLGSIFEVFFQDCFILFRIKDLLEINCQKKTEKACPCLPVLSVSCPLHSHRKIDNPFLSQVDMLRFLLEAKADKDSYGQHGATPLLAAFDLLRRHVCVLSSKFFDVCCSFSWKRIDIASYSFQCFHMFPPFTEQRWLLRWVSRMPSKLWWMQTQSLGTFWYT